MFYHSALHHPQGESKREINDLNTECLSKLLSSFGSYPPVG
jgi:hypothetical protein